MSQIIRIEMADCENQLLREIGDKQFTRRDVAQTYWYAMNSSERKTIDWAKVNGAIIDRWSMHALEWIKYQAWSKKCFEPRKPRKESA